MTAVETRIRLLADDTFEKLGDGPKRVGRRVVVHADSRQRALLQGAAVVAHAAFQNVCIRKNDLFAAVAAQPRGLYADVLLFAGVRIDLQAVARGEGLVQR